MNSDYSMPTKVFLFVFVALLVLTGCASPNKQPLPYWEDIERVSIPVIKDH